MSQWLAVATPVLSLLLSGFAVYLVFQQIRIMKRQTEVMERQLEIMRKQDDLLARRAELRVYLSGSRENGKVRLQVLAANEGKAATIRDFFWHLLIPSAVATEIRSASGVRSFETMADVQWTHFNGGVLSPLYPSRKTELTTLELVNAAPGRWPIRWLLVSEYGTFPPDNTYAEIEVAIT